ncbi:hypothetical protein J3B02_001099 [Coemansia erecta]|uniref:Uncharacterized protein n=1 Tax=Coemansia asiatica TaxID=1052880 RepID=A0A9W7XR63_9FUNG|nr:hypothetical protein LPJ64_000360 [Coemansia asiatica]KAJ2857290.1 hypothetical protein J3B02_001099 [Coemansia erecta]KAJ2889058.1 hypothetical protein FB639_000177 [Coemansia asiatica]
MAQAEVVTDAELTTMTIVARVTSTATPEYHLWDVFTNRAHGFFAPKISHANDIYSQGQRDAADAGNYITSNIVDYGQQVKKNVNDMGEGAKDRVYSLGNQAKVSFDELGQEIKADVNRAENAIKEDGQSIKGKAQKKANNWGRDIKDDAERAKDRAQDDVHYVTKRIKHAGDDFYDKIYVESDRMTNEARHAAQQANLKSQEMSSGIRGYISRKLNGAASFIRGSGMQLRSDLGSSMNRLRDSVSSGLENATPSWPEKVFDSNRDPLVADYIHKLNQAAQQANSQVSSKLDMQSDIIEKIATRHLYSQLPLAGCYVPFVLLVVVFLVGRIWSYKAQLRRRVVQATSAAGSSAETTLAFQQEYFRISDAITTSCTYLVIIPMTTLILVIMELNGMANWLIGSCYTCLLAGSFAATQMSTLADLSPRSGNDVVAVGQRVTLGITVVIAVCCFINSLVY